MKTQLSRNLHFREAGFGAHASHLSDRDYSMVLDNAVIACVDIVVLSDEEMFVGKRRDAPAMHKWWTLGGKMIPGKTKEQSAQEILHRETQLRIEDTSRFISLDYTPDFVWNTRAQEPVCHGCHMQTSFYAILLQKDEKDRVRPTQGIQRNRWINVNDVAHATLDIELHDAIKQAALRTSIFLGMTRRSLCERFMSRAMRRFYQRP